MKILSEVHDGRSLRLELEGYGDSSVDLFVRRNNQDLTLKVDGGTIVANDRVRVLFPTGTGISGER
jgi:hypothetical protein